LFLFLLLLIAKENAILGSMFRLKEKMIFRSLSDTAASLEKRSGGMLMLIAILVLLLHVMAIIWLRQSKDLPSEYNTPLPFKLEVTLLGKDNPKSIVTPPQTNPQPETKFKPKPKTRPKPAPKKAPPVKEKLPDLGEIEKLIKSQPVKQVSKSVKYQPDQQTAHTIASAMIMPSTGDAPARDNFPISDLHNQSPEYPEMAIFLGYQGNALVRIKVSAKGLTEGVEILRSSGHKILDESTVNALKKWRFTPSKRGNTPIASSVIISVIYVLYDKNS
jgi:protein TonB